LGAERSSRAVVVPKKGQMTQTAAILTVCTGNVCRSPVLERLLRLGFAQHWPAAVDPLPVASAGTHALVGHSIPAPLMGRLRAVGGDATPFAARQLTRDMISEAELVIALTRAHRAVVVELHPKAVRITFTLRELARIARQLPPGDTAPLEPLARLRTFVAAIAGSRGRAAPSDPDADDIVDPYRGDDARYQLAWTQLVAGTSAFMRALVPQGEVT
jgi:protein-tyrosine phosphatase